MSLTFVAVGHLDDIPPLGARCVRTARGPVGVFRTADDRVFALDNRCPHRGGPLSEGIVHGHAVTCPLHGAVLSLESGAVEGPDGGGVATIPVEVVDGEIRLGLVLAAADADAVVGDAGPGDAAPGTADLAASAKTVIEAGPTPPTLPNTATRRIVAGAA